jgi:GH24 family phage-related lysozyme (muramidase)
VTYKMLRNYTLRSNQSIKLIIRADNNLQIITLINPIMYTCITDFLYNVGIISCKKQLWPIINKDDYNKSANGMATECNNYET